MLGDPAEPSHAPPEAFLTDQPDLEGWIGFLSISIACPTGAVCSVCSDLPYTAFICCIIQKSSLILVTWIFRADAIKPPQVSSPCEAVIATGNANGPLADELSLRMMRPLRGSTFDERMLTKCCDAGNDPNSSMNPSLAGISTIKGPRVVTPAVQAHIDFEVAKIWALDEFRKRQKGAGWPAARIPHPVICKHAKPSLFPPDNTPSASIPAYYGTSNRPPPPPPPFCLPLPFSLPSFPCSCADLTVPPHCWAGICVVVFAACAAIAYHQRLEQPGTRSVIHSMQYTNSCIPYTFRLPAEPA